MAVGRPKNPLGFWNGIFTPTLKGESIELSVRNLIAWHPFRERGFWNSLFALLEFKQRRSLVESQVSHLFN